MRPFRPSRSPLRIGLAGLQIATLTAGLVAAGCTGAEQAASPPNLVLIISDDHGWTDYGFLGHQVIQTPAIDRLAAQSMVYTRGYLPTALCRPSLATLATGLYPHQHGITGNDPPGQWPAIARDAESRARMEAVFARNPNVVELLGRSGYVSHQSGKWWEGNPLDHGFTAAMTHGDVNRKGRHGDEGLVIGREGMEPIFDFLEGVGDQPFFLWYAPFLPHTPHNPPERLLEKYSAPETPERVAKYYAMVEWLDETVGQLLDHLDQSGLADNTVVLYLADNGWIAAEEAEQQARVPAKMSPYDMGIRTPVMVRWPGHVEPGLDDRTLVSSVDVVPTLLKAAGVEAPPGVPGIDLRDVAALADRDRVFGTLFAHTAVNVEQPVENLKYRSVIRSDGWKLILPYQPNSEVTLTIRGTVADWMRLEPELYQVLEDPLETVNLALERPEMVAELHGAIQDWWAVPEE